MSKIVSSRTSQFSQYISFQQSQSPLTSALRPPHPPPPIVFFFFLGSAFPLLNLLLLYDPQMKKKNKNKNKKPGSYAGCLPYNFLCSMEHSCGGARLRRPSLILLMFRAWINSTQWKYCSNWRLLSRLNCYPLCGESCISLEKEEKQRRTIWTVWNELWWRCRYEIGVPLYTPNCNKVVIEKSEKQKVK